MRNFTVKTLLAALTGTGLIIWLELCYLYYYGEIKEIIYPFLYNWESINNLSSSSFNIPYTIIFAISCIFIISIIIYNLTNRHKDKIQTRAYISFIHTVLIFSLTGYFFLRDPMNVQLTIITMSSIIFAHYFALISKKRDIYLFIGLISFYLLVYLHLLLESILN